jgi:16S rRNA (cytosine967-C5)-methyltransferase
MERQKLKTENNKLSARQVTLEVLTGLDIQKHDASTRLDKLMDKTSERARATDLVFGVIRNLTALDYVLQKTAAIKLEHTNKKILTLLRIGAYELIYVPATPEYAILNDAATLAAAVSKKSAGFVNAVLRNLQRAIHNRCLPLEEQDPLRTLPTTDHAGCVFNIDILPDPRQDLAVFLGQTFSLPAWLIRHWLIDFGPQQTLQICHASNRRPSVILRPNTLKTTVQKLYEQLKSEETEVLLSPDKTGLKMLQSVDIARLKSFQEGLFYIQDAAAFGAINLLKISPNQTVVDLCAAPGTKTAVLAGAMQNTGTIYATDADAKRLQKVAQNCQRLGIENVNIIDPTKLNSFLSQKPIIDVILIDVPCSNTGVLARRAEARHRLDEKSVLNLTRTQSGLLQKAIAAVRPGGSVLYSTCSILKQENQSLINEFLKQNSGACLVREQFILPAVETQDSFDHDGGYAALLQKKL